MTDTAVRIPLQRRDGSLIAHAVVDPMDAKWLTQWTWRLDRYGYAFRCEQHEGKSRTIRMAREILGLSENDGREADHIDGDRLNNTRANLRDVSHAENMTNVAYGGFGRSRYRGVTFHNGSGLWMARAGRKLIGYFHDEDAAGQAASEYRAKHWNIREAVS